MLQNWLAGIPVYAIPLPICLSFTFSLVWIHQWSDVICHLQSWLYILPRYIGHRRQQPPVNYVPSYTRAALHGITGTWPCGEPAPLEQTIKARARGRPNKQVCAGREQTAIPCPGSPEEAHVELEAGYGWGEDAQSTSRLPTQTWQRQTTTEIVDTRGFQLWSHRMDWRLVHLASL
jgi:hypothetical protein